MKTPETSKEITDAAFDGDPLTGYDQAHAFNGDVASQARHRFALDGRSDTLDAENLRRENAKRENAKFLPQSPWDAPSMKPNGY